MCRDVERINAVRFGQSRSSECCGPVPIIAKRHAGGWITRPLGPRVVRKGRLRNRRHRRAHRCKREAEGRANLSSRPDGACDVLSRSERSWERKEDRFARGSITSTCTSPVYASDDDDPVGGRGRRPAAFGSGVAGNVDQLLLTGLYAKPPDTSSLYSLPPTT